jgi:hypothetical protein
MKNEIFISTIFTKRSPSDVILIQKYKYNSTTVGSSGKQHYS